MNLSTSEVDVAVEEDIRDALSSKRAKEKSIRENVDTTLCCGV